VEKLKYILDSAKSMVKDCETERMYLETKLHNFIYIWLVIVMSMCTLFGKTFDSYMQYLTTESYVLFFLYQFISIFIITSLFLRVYRYRGIYYVLRDIKTPVTHLDKNDSIEELMRNELQACITCIEENTKLNNRRNKHFNLTRLVFSIYLIGTFLGIIVVFAIN
jgi:hypothetical protein